MFMQKEYKYIIIKSIKMRYLNIFTKYQLENDKNVNYYL